MSTRSLLVVLLALQGCAVAPVTVKSLPPAALLEPCPEDVREFRTNADLAQGILALRHSLRVCNNQLQALREWAEKETHEQD